MDKEFLSNHKYESQRMGNKKSPGYIKLIKLFYKNFYNTKNKTHAFSSIFVQNAWVSVL